MGLQACLQYIRQWVCAELLFLSLLGRLVRTAATFCLAETLAAVTLLLA